MRARADTDYAAVMSSQRSLFDDLFNDAIHSDYVNLLLSRGLPVEYIDTSAIAAITAMKKAYFEQLSPKLQGTVPFAVDVGIAFDYDDYHTLGRMLLHCLIGKYTMSAVHPIITAALVCSDLHRLSEAYTDDEMFKLMRLYDESTVNHLLNFIEQPFDENSMDLSFLGQTNDMDASTSDKRYVMICTYLRQTLIVNRLPALTSIRDGFLSVRQLLPAIRLFNATQLRSLLVSTVDITCQELLQQICVSGSDIEKRIFEDAVCLFTPEMIRRFLKFVTNHTYLKDDIRVSIENMDDDYAFICSSCFNKLKISSYVCSLGVKPLFDNIATLLLDCGDTLFVYTRE